MARNIQEYINSLINKPRIYYLDLNNLTNTQTCSHCNQKTRDCQKTLEGEITDLSEFANLRGINASNNQFTNLNFLQSLPNKDKLRGLNLFGNQLREVDFAELWTKFPNLEKINFQNNPLSAKNLNNLTSEQFGKLVKGIKDKKISIYSFKGTVLTDLLTHAQQLASQGRPGFNAYIQTLNEVSQPTKANEKPNSNNNAPLLVGGLVLLGISILTIGYL
jgi:hypothetical protein